MDLLGFSAGKNQKPQSDKSGWSVKQSNVETASFASGGTVTITIITAGSSSDHIARNHKTLWFNSQSTDNFRYVSLSSFVILTEIFIA